MEQIKTVHYVTKDQIQNLKIKVTLTRISVQRSRVRLNAVGQVLEAPPALGGAAVSQGGAGLTPQPQAAQQRPTVQTHQQQLQPTPQPQQPTPQQQPAPQQQQGAPVNDRFNSASVDTSLRGFDAVQQQPLQQRLGPLQQAVRQGGPPAPGAQQGAPAATPAKNPQQQGDTQQQAEPPAEGPLRQAQKQLRESQNAPLPTRVSGGAPNPDAPTLRPTNSVGLPVPPPGANKFFSPLSANITGGEAPSEFQPLRKGQPLGEANENSPYGSSPIVFSQGAPSYQQQQQQQQQSVLNQSSQLSYSQGQFNPEAGQQGYSQQQQAFSPQLQPQPSPLTSSAEYGQQPFSYNPQQSGGSYNPQQPGGSYNPQQPGGSYNPQQPGGSYNPQQSGGSYNPQQPGGSYNPQQSEGSYNPQQPGGSYNPQQQGYQQASGAAGFQQGDYPSSYQNPMQSHEIEAQQAPDQYGGYSNAGPGGVPQFFSQQGGFGVAPQPSLSAQEQYQQYYQQQFPASHSTGWDGRSSVAQWQAQAPQFDPTTGQFFSGGGGTPMQYNQGQGGDQFSFPSLTPPPGLDPNNMGGSQGGYGVGPDGTPVPSYQFGYLSNFPDYRSMSAAGQYTGWPMVPAPDGSTMPAPIGPNGMPLPMHAYPILGPNGQPVIGPDGHPMYGYGPIDAVAAAAAGWDGMSAMGMDPGVDPGVSNWHQPGVGQPGPPQRFAASRVFSWQEKVFSRSEVMASGGQAAFQQQEELLNNMGVDNLMGSDQTNEARWRTRRNTAIGSSVTPQAKSKTMGNTQGSVLFTYIQTDDFCDQIESRKRVTTSWYEQLLPLYQTIMGNPKMKQQVLNFRAMYIMADLADEQEAFSVNEKVLISLKAFPDGSFDMRPGFNRPGGKYRFEDDAGGIYEYTVENASATEGASLDRRTAKLQKAVGIRAEEMRRNALLAEFTPPPENDESKRLMLYGEIMAAADFAHDHLYIEFVVRFDAELWELKTPWVQPEPGVCKGVTHISRPVWYPADTASETPTRSVAHFAHPIELEWETKCTEADSKPPAIFFQVCALDRQNRYTCEGYGWLALPSCKPASAVHYVKAWKPLGSIRDWNESFFVGGSPELDDITYLTTPTGFDSQVLNKYGFKTQTSGEIKVRLHVLTQQFDPEIDVMLSKRPFAQSPSKDGQGSPTKGGRNRRDVSLETVVLRARQRLREARGTDDITVRPGLVSEAPLVRVHPVDLNVQEGHIAEFKVVATGLGPLRYQWYKDDKKLSGATSDNDMIILPAVETSHRGIYYCQVSNKDGSVNSNKATLKVDRLGRAHRAAGEMGGSGSVRLAQPYHPPGQPRSKASTPMRVSRLQAVSGPRPWDSMPPSPGAYSVVDQPIATTGLTSDNSGATAAAATASQPADRAVTADGSQVITSSVVEQALVGDAAKAQERVLPVVEDDASQVTASSTQQTSQFASSLTTALKPISTAAAQSGVVDGTHQPSTSSAHRADTTTSTSRADATSRPTSTTPASATSSRHLTAPVGEVEDLEEELLDDASLKETKVTSTGSKPSSRPESTSSGKADRQRM